MKIISNGNEKLCNMYKITISYRNLLQNKQILKSLLNSWKKETKS